MNKKQSIFVPGPCGQLEAILTTPQDTPNAVGIICHPHPQQEGTMHNKVVTALSWAMEAMGWATLRFNYRGVGKSAGEYAQQIGEIDDGLAAYKWIQEKYPQCPIHMAGFSFGAFIAATVCNQLPCQSLVTAAPVVHHSNYNQLTNINCPWLAVVGEQDEIVTAEQIKELQTLQNFNFELTAFANTTHFFHGQLIPLREKVKMFYNSIC